MKTTKSVEVPARPARTQEFEVVNCDGCGAEIKRDGYEFKEATVEFCSGASYPEGGSCDVRSFDICPKCWVEKLEPALVPIFGAPQVTDRGW